MLIPPVHIQYHQVLYHLSFRDELGSQQINTLLPFLCPLICGFWFILFFFFLLHPALLALFFFNQLCHKL